MITFCFEWWNWPKHQIAKCQIIVFSIAINFIDQKLKFCKIEKEDTLITLLSAWDRSRDSTAKRNLSKHMWRSLVFCHWYPDPSSALCFLKVRKSWNQFIEGELKTACNLTLKNWWGLNTEYCISANSFRRNYSRAETIHRITVYELPWEYK